MVILSVPKQVSLVWYLPIVNLLGLVFTSLYFPQYVLFDENRKCWLYSSQTLFSINLLDFPYQVATEVKSSLILNFQQKHYLVLQLQQHMRIMESLQTDPWKTHLPPHFHINELNKLKSCKWQASSFFNTLFTQYNICASTFTPIPRLLLLRN